MEVEELIVVIRNIPEAYTVLHLRLHFSSWVESGKFQNFHYLRRPELIQVAETSSRHEEGSKKNQIKKTFCVIVKLAKGEDSRVFQKEFSGKQWEEKDGSLLSTHCVIEIVKTPQAVKPPRFLVPGAKKEYLTNQQKLDRLKAKDPDDEHSGFNGIENCAEFFPPKGLPNGNVGTPMKVLRENVTKCILPLNNLPKLGIHELFKDYVPSGHNELHYHKVPYSYDNTTGDQPPIYHYGVHDNSDNTTSTGSGQILNSAFSGENVGKRKKSIEKGWMSASSSSEEESDQEVEEWDYGQSLMKTDDMDGDDDGDEGNYDRLNVNNRMSSTKFEEPIELIWEKGGSGLVFYTDDVYWDTLQGDMDEQEADDFDIEIDWHSLPSNTRKKLKRKKKKFKTVTICEDEANKIGEFEKHTKKIGSKILAKYGWKPGDPLKTSNMNGLTVPLIAKGEQTTLGLGQYGKQKKDANLKRYAQQRNTLLPLKGRFIATIYDRESSLPSDTTHNTNNTTGSNLALQHIAFVQTSNPIEVDEGE